MNSSRRQEIKNLAEEIRKRLELESLPVDVDQAVARLGGQIVEADDSEEGEAYVKREGQSFVIGLQSQPKARRRFSVAHELGHLFVHMGYIVDPKKWETIKPYRDSPRYRFGFSEEEYEAHEFAGAFLMPERQFRHHVAVNTEDGGTNLSEIARVFDVSVDAVRVRGQWLGVFQWER